MVNGSIFKNFYRDLLANGLKLLRLFTCLICFLVACKDSQPGSENDQLKDGDKGNVTGQKTFESQLSELRLSLISDNQSQIQVKFCEPDNDCPVLSLNPERSLNIVFKASDIFSGRLCRDTKDCDAWQYILLRPLDYEVNISPREGQYIHSAAFSYGFTGQSIAMFNQEISLITNYLNIDQELLENPRLIHKNLESNDIQLNGYNYDLHLDHLA